MTTASKLQHWFFSESPTCWAILQILYLSVHINCMSQFFKVNLFLWYAHPTGSIFLEISNVYILKGYGWYIYVCVCVCVCVYHLAIYIDKQ